MNHQWIALTYVLVDDEDTTFACIVEKYVMKENYNHEKSRFIGR